MEEEGEAARTRVVAVVGGGGRIIVTVDVSLCLIQGLLHSVAGACMLERRPGLVLQLLLSGASYRDTVFLSKPTSLACHRHA
ncbi:hypothetical protein J6590_048284 [Homalodisca vitripennis]|nr:hypothetical protein J6590_048284 [Homalodisca vitripennis]